MTLTFKDDRLLDARLDRGDQKPLQCLLRQACINDQGTPEKKTYPAR